LKKFEQEANEEFDSEQLLYISSLEAQLEENL
jgi:hypothetical protein